MTVQLFKILFIAWIQLTACKCEGPRIYTKTAGSNKLLSACWACTFAMRTRNLIWTAQCTTLGDALLLKYRGRNESVPFQYKYRFIFTKTIYLIFSKHRKDFSKWIKNTFFHNGQQDDVFASILLEVFVAKKFLQMAWTISPLFRVCSQSVNMKMSSGDKYFLFSTSTNTEPEGPIWNFVAFGVRKEVLKLSVIDAIFCIRSSFTNVKSSSGNRGCGPLPFLVF